MSAEIISLDDYRSDDLIDGEIDLVTAVEVAIRDLREVLLFWGSDKARERTEECVATLRGAIGHRRLI